MEEKRERLRRGGGEEAQRARRRGEEPRHRLRPVLPEPGYGHVLQEEQKAA